MNIKMEVGQRHRGTDSTGWEHDRYRVTLTHGDKAMQLMYRKGVGHNGEPPTLEEVLESIASDCQSVDSTDGFADWANELGYSPDSIRALRIYNACVRQAFDFHALLNHDEEQYNSIVYPDE